jgi:hypothetical protein
MSVSGHVTKILAIGFLSRRRAPKVGPTLTCETMDRVAEAKDKEIGDSGSIKVLGEEQKLVTNI